MASGKTTKSEPRTAISPEASELPRVHELIAKQSKATGSAAARPPSSGGAAVRPGSAKRTASGAEEPKGSDASKSARRSGTKQGAEAGTGAPRVAAGTTATRTTSVGKPTKTASGRGSRSERATSREPAKSADAPTAARVEQEMDANGGRAALLRTDAEPSFGRPEPTAVAASEKPSWKTPTAEAAVVEGNGARPRKAAKIAATLVALRREATPISNANDRTQVTKKIDKKTAAEQNAAGERDEQTQLEAGAIVGDSVVADATRSAARGPVAKAAIVSEAISTGKAAAKAADPDQVVTEPALRARAAAPKPAERVPTPATKGGKAAGAPRLGFKPHEFIVYPAHGVGQIVVIEEQVVAGFKLELFVISFIKDKMILKVPTSKAAAVGMRKLADADVVKKAFDTLGGRARIKRTMWSRRAQEYEAKINSGDLVAIAEVVRDLYRSDSQPEQSYSERQLYEAALDRMAREIIAVQKLTETEALKAIEAQLMKGPRRGKSEEIEPDEAEIEEAA
jgi:CarD family transcriptional regulator